MGQDQPRKSLPLDWKDVAGAYPCSINKKGEIIGLSRLPPNSEAVLLVRTKEQTDPEAKERIRKLEDSVKEMSNKLDAVLEFMVKKVNK